MQGLPYLELPVVLGGTPEIEAKEGKGFFNPSEVDVYHEGYYPDSTFIYIKGQPYQIALTLEQYVDRVKKYYETIFAKQSIKQKLKVI